MTEDGVVAVADADQADLAQRIRDELPRDPVDGQPAGMR